MCLLLSLIVINQLEDIVSPPVEGKWKNFGEIGIYSTYGNNIFSPTWNPANCSFLKQHLVLFELFSIQTSFVNKYLWNSNKSEFLDDKTKSTIINSINKNFYVYKNVLGKEILSITYKKYTFTYITRGYWFSKTPKDIISWILFGNELEKKYNFSGGKSSTQIVNEFGLSIGLPFIKKDDVVVSCGIKLKYLRGASCLNVDSTRGIIETTWDTTINTAAFFLSSSDGGNGFGLDIGIAGFLHGKIYTGICIENLYNIISWDKNTLQRELLLDIFLDGTDSSMVKDISEIPAFRTYLPIEVKTIISYNLGNIRFTFLSLVGQYQTYSFSVCWKTLKYLSLNGGIRYSFFGLSPRFEVEIIPISQFKFSGGYHRREGVLFSKDGYNSTYFVSFMVSF
jgi:hypothetical protein